ncbi:hypothetical protein MHYP_G00025480 [Metynnis hypsauchen]
MRLIRTMDDIQTWLPEAAGDDNKSGLQTRPLLCHVRFFTICHSKWGSNARTPQSEQEGDRRSKCNRETEREKNLICSPSLICCGAEAWSGVLHLKPLTGSVATGFLIHGKDRGERHGKTPPDLMFYGWGWGMIHLGMGKGMRPLSLAPLATQSAQPLPDCLQALFVPALILRQRGLMGSWLADRTAVNMLAPSFSYQK